MLPFNSTPKNVIRTEFHSIAEFGGNENIDVKTVESFGEEWGKFSSFTEEEITNVGREYFDIVSDQVLNNKTVVLDVGCGSGRWAYYLAKKAKFVEAIDPSNAVLSASNLLSKFSNVRITKASVDNIPFKDGSFDLVISLGVLHHVPDTAKAVKSCVDKVKPGGHFLVYLYYSLDNRGILYKIIFQLSVFFRLIISKLPSFLKKLICDFIAFAIYLPLVLVSKFLVNVGLTKLASKMPLFYYVDKTLFVIRNDALDRFGTPLEQRFSKIRIKEIMEDAGLYDVVFSDKAPFWHAIGTKK